MSLHQSNLHSYGLRTPAKGVSCKVWYRPSCIVPRGSYPTPFLGYLVFWLGSVIRKSRRPKKGVGYEPLGIGMYGVRVFSGIHVQDA